MSGEIPLGILFSVTGTYSLIGQACLAGARLGLEEVNGDPRYPFRFRAEIEDPGANIDDYHALSEAMLRERGCRHIIGTITSIGRKEVIPIIEKYDALLWYMCPYEGFECCENVIYTGASPNQHIVPLFRHLLPRYGKRVYLVGSNYIWGWETNRTARELVQASGGEVAGEKYLPFSAQDVGRLIEDIREQRPDFVLNNLVGTSSYAFLAAYHAAAREDASFAPGRRPVVSCNLTEAELDSVGPAQAGLISTAIYFDSLETPASHAFRQRVRARFGAARRNSVYLVNAYVAVKLLAEAILACGSDEIEAVKEALFALDLDTPLGTTRIDRRTNHAALRPYIGRVEGDGVFKVIEAAPEPIAADPYLVDFDARAFAADVERRSAAGTGPARLKVVK
ncbi:transporter substrate-binding domain-containing protein [Pelagibius sp. CAU 1746]|uniref:transporter substrate-binding domain-containing protein n=1 Tax=Pelagibius sp. CAU 1746 TaxID=3140370 RepID=UPI00325A5B63